MSQYMSWFDGTDYSCSPLPSMMSPYKGTPCFKAGDIEHAYTVDAIAEAISGALFTSGCGGEAYSGLVQDPYAGLESSSWWCDLFFRPGARLKLISFFP